ncbi:MAG: hypothetical protein IIA87_00195 [Nanoarchaeota archaeon]|nr:hypothetical protein [Nanoarchaeota archaeon]
MVNHLKEEDMNGFETREQIDEWYSKAIKGLGKIVFSSNLKKSISLDVTVRYMGTLKRKVYESLGLNPDDAEVWTYDAFQKRYCKNSDNN